MRQRRGHRRSATALILALGWLGAVSAAAQELGSDPSLEGDDLFLRLISISPNVILILDNSTSMNHIEWHPAFDPDAASYGCSAFDNSTVYGYDQKVTETWCGNDRTIWAPTAPSADTLWDGRYLNWYFSDDADAYYDEIRTATAETAGCTEAAASKFFDHQYRRTRFEAAKQVILDLLCVAESKNVRFGMAIFRDAADSAGKDPNGGFVKVDIGRANPNHAAEVEGAIKNADIASETPLAETLFQVYTFWMSRDDTQLPLGQDGLTKFPRYQYDKFGVWTTNPLPWLEDPAAVPCERSFVIVVSDGVPTRDDFDADPAETAYGFAQFDDLIGDYHADGETETPGGPDETSWYLDDIAKYMQDNDFRPDHDGDQLIDTYAVGFNTTGQADGLLQKTADVGNGLFFHVENGDELAAALLEALNDIVEKAQSFTASSVPSARTADGGDFYQTFFFPRKSTAFWEGHIRAWKVQPNGDIHDASDPSQCALDDPDVGECNSGPFKPSATYFWDAAEEMPASGTTNGSGVRKLFASKLSSASPPLPTKVVFDDALTADDLGLAAFAAAPDPAPNSAEYPLQGSTALSAEGLADEIVAFGRGCSFGTGVSDSSLVGTPASCVERAATLGDIFHSAPVVVTHPKAPLTGPSYRAFREHYASRKRVLYAGTNGGFLEAFDAGTWQASATPPHYDEGTGEELFGFMPWAVRQQIKSLPVDFPTARTHYVDGASQTADVWLYPAANTTAKSDTGSEWRSYLVGGLRRGGKHYYALDITNPNQIAGPAGTPGPGGVLPYPGFTPGLSPSYGWEFPTEDDPDSDLVYMGQTWGQPIITRVRVRNNCTGDCPVYERWVAIVSGGNDPVTGDPNQTSYDATVTAGRSIFIIDMKTGQVMAEKKLDSGASDAQTDMEYATPATPAVFDLNFDGFADVIYVADLGGQVFKWVISAVGEDRVNDSSGLRTQPNWPFKLFFEAPTAGGDHYKNFYFSPAGALADGKLWLAFGSGERANLPFVNTKNNVDAQNRFYVVMDLDPLEKLLTPLPTITEGDLKDATSQPGGVALTTQRGFFFKVPDGEKFVTNTQIFAGKVLVSTFEPTVGEVCQARGSATLYVFDLTTGEGYFTDGGGQPTRGLYIGSGLPSDPRLSVGVGGKDNRVYIEKSGGDLMSIDQEDIPAGGRVLYWRELR